MICCDRFAEGGRCGEIVHAEPDDETEWFIRSFGTFIIVRSVVQRLRAKGSEEHRKRGPGPELGLTRHSTLTGWGPGVLASLVASGSRLVSSGIMRLTEGAQ